MTSVPPESADVLLADGTVAVIRPLRAQDRRGLEALHADASDDSFRLRFFSIGRKAGFDYVEHLFSDRGPAVCLVAAVHDHIVAVAAAERIDQDAAEVAFLVADPLRGHGVGSLLLEHLAAAGRDLGIRRFTAEVLGENTAMSKVFLSVGFHVTRKTTHGVIDVEMSTAASTRAVAAADERESRSEARSLAPLTRPHRVAVVGVRSGETGIGHAIVQSILAGGFTGDVVAVHPHAASIDGVPAYPSLSEVPGHVDIAVIAVPASAALDVTQDAVTAGVSTMVVISSGFAELGAQGAELQIAMARLARDNSIRVVGPNCLGVMINDPAVRLNATFTRLVPPAGGLAVASQSGGVGIALLDVATRMELGLSSFVSLGNKADVSGNDLLAAWLEDPRVSAAALYLESFGNAPKFARIARRFSEQKPLLVVMGGRSAGGQRGGASHTAAAATPAVAVEALFAHTGVISCNSAEAMAETALLVAEQPHPEGSRVAVISNAGGLGVLAADAADTAGLIVPELSASLRALLQHHGTAGTGNPVDLGANASASDLGAAAKDVLASGEVDALLVVLVATSVADPTPLPLALGEARASHPNVPVVLVTMGGLRSAPGDLPGVTVLSSVDAAVDAMARVSRYAAWLRAPRGEPTPHDPMRADASRRVAGRILAEGSTDGGWIPPQQTTELLAPYGLVPTGQVAHDGIEAADTAAAVGFPVAVKVADPRVVHKTDRGLVRIGLRSTADVTAAVQAFEDEVGTSPVDVLVQPMAVGVEIALGLFRDPSFGPLVMVAAGGVATDLSDDRVFLIPPLDPLDVSRALRSLRSWPLLDGYRGADPVNVADLEHMIVSLGQLGLDVPHIAELDVNPVVVTAERTHLIDVKVRLAPSVSLDAGVPRRLRAPH